MYRLAYNFRGSHRPKIANDTTSLSTYFHTSSSPARADISQRVQKGYQS